MPSVRRRGLVGLIALALASADMASLAEPAVEKEVLPQPLVAALAGRKAAPAQARTSTRSRGSARRRGIEGMRQAFLDAEPLSTAS